MKNNIKTRNTIQLISLGIWLVLLLYVAQVKMGTCHQFCPFSVVCFGPMAVQGYAAFIPTICISLVTTILVIFIGRKFCSYLCFLGTIQEYIHSLNKKKRKRRVPPNIHKFLSSLKYLYLIVVLVMAILLVQYKYLQFCPIISISFISSISIIGIISLIIIFLGSYFVDRFWCRYLCPYAALMNIFQFIGKIFKIKRHKINRNMEVCIDCYLCTKKCPMNIDLTKYEVIDDANCIHCQKCIEVCPKDKCLTC
jgi:ferredoxin-type protein NapH